jgi:hypothetical protein
MDNFEHFWQKGFPRPFQEIPLLSQEPTPRGLLREAGAERPRPAERELKIFDHLQFS